jgi:hypothetical protein
MVGYQNPSMLTRHRAWRLGFDGVRETPETRQASNCYSPPTRDLNAQKGPNLRFRPAFTTLMFAVTPTEVVAIPHTAVVQTKVLELLLLKL